MDDKSIKEVIDYGIHKYFEVKADKELRFKMEAEGIQQSKKTLKDTDKNFTAVIQIMLIIIAVVGCYVFLKNRGVI